MSRLLWCADMVLVAHTVLKQHTQIHTHTLILFGLVDVCLVHWFRETMLLVIISLWHNTEMNPKKVLSSLTGRYPCNSGLLHISAASCCSSFSSRFTGSVMVGLENGNENYSIMSKKNALHKIQFKPAQHKTWVLKWLMLYKVRF